MPVRVKYRADQADRNYGRSTAQVFPDIKSGVAFLRQLPSDAPVAFEDVATGASIPAAMNLLAGPDINAYDFTTIPRSWGRRWRQQRDLAGSQLVRVHFWGDSITMGGGLPAVDGIPQGYAGIVSEILRYTYGDGGSGYLTQDIATSTTGTWTLSQGYGGSLGRATTTATKNFSNLVGNQLKVFCENRTGSQFRYRVDGGSFTTISPPLGFGLEPGNSPPVTMGPGTHSVDVEWVAGTFGFHGIEVRNDFTNGTGIWVSRMGMSGRAISDFTRMERQLINVGLTNGSNQITAAGPGVFNSSMIGMYINCAGLAGDITITGAPTVTGAALSANATQTGTQAATLSVNPPSWGSVVANTQFPFLADGQGRPDLLIIALGVNDPASTPRRLTDVADGLSAIMSPNVNGTTLNYTPDVVVILEHQGNWFDQDREWPGIAAQTRELASGFGAAFIDIWGLGRRSHQYWEDLNLFSDNIHPNRAGHTVYARALLDVLLS